MASPSTSTTSGALVTCTPSSRADWFQSLKRDMKSVFFTTVNPMYANQDLEEIQYDLDKPRIAVYKKDAENSPKHRKLVQYEARSKKRIEVLSNSIARNRSLKPTHYLRFVSRERYTGRLEKFILQSFQSPKLLRVVLMLNSQYGRQDRPVPDEKIHRPKRTERQIQRNLSLTSRRHKSHASQRKSAMEEQRNLSR